jgi:hypothetical protein
VRQQRAQQRAPQLTHMCSTCRSAFPGVNDYRSRFFTAMVAPFLVLLGLLFAYLLWKPLSDRFPHPLQPHLRFIHRGATRRKSSLVMAMKTRGVEGNVETFARTMTEKAQKYGMPLDDSDEDELPDAAPFDTSAARRLAAPALSRETSSAPVTPAVPPSPKNQSYPKPPSPHATHQRQPSQPSRTLVVDGPDPPSHQAPAADTAPPELQRPASGDAVGRTVSMSVSEMPPARLISPATIHRPGDRYLAPAGERPVRKLSTLVTTDDPPGVTVERSLLARHCTAAAAAHRSRAPHAHRRRAWQTITVNTPVEKMDYDTVIKGKIVEDEYPCCQMGCGGKRCWVPVFDPIAVRSQREGAAADARRLLADQGLLHGRGLPADCHCAHSAGPHR